jgi:hypothetical protein
MFFHKFMNRHLWRLGFIPLPIALLIITQWQLDVRGPYYERFNSDPEYAYLLNGLKLANGESPNHVDHPGTTLQILSAVVIDFHHLLKDFLVVRTLRTEDVLRNPEEYLKTINGFMAFGVAFLLFFIAVQIYNKTKLIWIAIVFQLFPFLSMTILRAMVRVSPEPLLTIMTLLVIILLIEVMEKKRPVYSIWYPILMGLILGAGLVTKLTFLPFLLLALWFPRLRDRILVITSCIGSFCLLTIPIWSRANYIIGWIKSLVFKQGYYGSGAKGLLPPFQTLMSNLIILIRVEPFYFIALAMLVLEYVLSWKSKTSENKLERLRVSLLSGIIGIQLIMVLKFPSSHYMIPGLTFLGFIFLMGILKFQSIYLIGSNNFKKFRLALLTLLIGLATINTFKFFSSTQSINKDQLGTKKIDTFIQANYSSCIIIPYYGASDLRYALIFGNELAGNYFAESLTKFYPNTIQYNLWSRVFSSFTGENKENEIHNRLGRGECILLRGGSYIGPTDYYYNSHFDLEKIIVESGEWVYRLKAIISPSTHTPLQIDEGLKIPL